MFAFAALCPRSPNAEHSRAQAPPPRCPVVRHRRRRRASHASPPKAAPSFRLPWMLPQFVASRSTGSPRASKAARTPLGFRSEVKLLSQVNSPRVALHGCPVANCCSVLISNTAVCVTGVRHSSCLCSCLCLSRGGTHTVHGSSPRVALHGSTGGSPRVHTGGSPRVPALHGQYVFNVFTLTLQQSANTRIHFAPSSAHPTNTRGVNSQRLKLTPPPQTQHPPTVQYGDS